MEDFLDVIDEFSTFKKVVAILIFLMLTGYFYWQYFYKDIAKELTKTEEEIELLTTKIFKERQIAKNLKKYKEEVKKLDVKLSKVMKELPDKKEIPDLLTAVSKLAYNSGLEVKLFKPLKEIFQDFYVEVPVSLQVTGDFPSLMSFFDQVAHLSRIVVARNINIFDVRVIEEKGVKFESLFEVVTFRYMDKKERELIEKQKKKKKKRKKKR